MDHAPVLAVLGDLQAVVLGPGVLVPGAPRVLKARHLAGLALGQAQGDVVREPGGSPLPLGVPEGAGVAVDRRGGGAVGRRLTGALLGVGLGQGQGARGQRVLQGHAAAGDVHRHVHVPVPLGEAQGPRPAHQRGGGVDPLARASAGGVHTELLQARLTHGNVHVGAGGEPGDPHGVAAAHGQIGDGDLGLRGHRGVPGLGQGRVGGVVGHVDRGGRRPLPQGQGQGVVPGGGVGVAAQEPVQPGGVVGVTRPVRGDRGRRRLRAVTPVDAHRGARAQAGGGDAVGVGGGVRGDGGGVGDGARGGEHAHGDGRLLARAHAQARRGGQARLPGDLGGVVEVGALHGPARPDAAQPAHEVVHVTPGLGGPADLGVGGRTAPHEELVLVPAADRLGPQGGLVAQNARVAHARDNAGRVPLVVLAHVAGARAGPGQADGGGGVVLLVDVGRGAVGDDDLGPLLVDRAGHRGLVPDPVLDAVTGLHGRGRGLRPANGALTGVAHGLQDAAQGRVVRGLAVAAQHGVGLVTADVEEASGGHVRELPQDVAHKGEADLRVGVEVGVADVAGPVGRGGGLLGRARVGGAGRVELGDSVQGGVGVSGQVHLGHHGHEAGARVGHDVTELGLRVVAGTAQLLGGLAVVGVHGRPAGDLGQPGVVNGVPGLTALVGDLDPPPLVVSHVEVHVAHLEVGDLVNDLLDLVHGNEGAGRVDHDGAVLVAGRVGDAHGRGRPGGGQGGG